MKATLCLIAIPALSASLIGSASADHPRCRSIDHREGRQRHEIQQGIRSGELTRVEAARLIAGEREIARDEREDRRDGHLSLRERLDLQRDLNQEQRRIYRLKHNDRER